MLGTSWNSQNTEFINLALTVQPDCQSLPRKNLLRDRVVGPGKHATLDALLVAEFDQTL
jgi:hypothetical protein